MQEYLQKTQFSALMDEIGEILLLLAGSLALYILLWGLRLLSVAAGAATFILGLLLRARTREGRLRRREDRLRRRIGGELQLEAWCLCPGEQAHREAAELLRFSPRQITEDGALCGLPEGGTALVACARLHRSEKLTAREVAVFQRACIAAGAERGFLCGASGALPEAREQASLQPVILLPGREQMIDLAGAAHPATDAQLVELGRRKQGGHSLRTLRAGILHPQRAGKYLMYGLLLCGLYILAGQRVYLFTGLSCLALMALSRSARP